MSENVEFKKEKGYSHAKQYNVIFEWEIDEMSLLIRRSRAIHDDIVIKSPTFSSGSSIKDLWHLELVIKYEESNICVADQRKEWIRVYLVSNNERMTVNTSYLLFMLNNKKEKYSFKFSFLNYPYSKIIFGPLSEIYDTCYEIDDDCGIINIDKLLEEENSFLPNDTLTLCVDLTVYDHYTSSSHTIIPLNTTSHEISDDLKELFITKKKSDVVIIVGNKKFRAHKLILEARSPVFDAMFSHDMREKKENEIEIPDVDPEIFKKLLEFIYTDKVSDLDDIAKELLEIANKYQIQSLKEMCAVSISKTINAENVIGIMVFADRHNSKQLAEYAKKFIINDFISVNNTKEYEALETSHPSLFFDILKKYAAGNKI